MYKYFALIAILFASQACTDTNPDKYELKSPCVSASLSEVSAAQSPCVRRPANQHVG